MEDEDVEYRTTSLGRAGHLLCTFLSTKQNGRRRKHENISVYYREFVCEWYLNITGALLALCLESYQAWATYVEFNPYLTALSFSTTHSTTHSTTTLSTWSYYGEAKQSVHLRGWVFLSSTWERSYDKLWRFLCLGSRKWSTWVRRIFGFLGWSYMAGGCLERFLHFPCYMFSFSGRQTLHSSSYRHHITLKCVHTLLGELGEPPRSVHQGGTQQRNIYWNCERKRIADRMAG